MIQVIIVLNLKKKNFSVLKSFAQTIADGMVTMSGSYPAPFPTILTFQGHIDALVLAISGWGTKGNRGSHADYLTLVAAANVVKDDLRQLMHYCMDTTPNSAVDFAGVGWETKHEFNPVGALPGPGNLRVVRKKNVVVPGLIHYRWNKVKGANAYKVWVGDGTTITIPPPDSDVYQTVTSTSFDDIAGVPGTTRFIVVSCVGANPNSGFSGLAGQRVP